jgi:hypothetical protein
MKQIALTMPILTGLIIVVRHNINGCKRKKDSILNKLKRKG